MRGIFSALQSLHETSNVIHRDIKPENMVITDYNDLSKVKLIDFGLACKSRKHDRSDFAKCGTLLYTPPEQILKNFAYAKVSPFPLKTCRKLISGPQESSCTS
jgi:serine/threonine protein kinase